MLNDTATADLVFAGTSQTLPRPPYRIGETRAWETKILIMCIVVALLGITTTLALVGVQQIQVDSLVSRVKTMDARIAASATKVDATLAQIASKITNDIEMPMMDQSEMTEYTLQGIQETYKNVNKLRDGFVMLVNLLQQQQQTRTLRPTSKKWLQLLNLTLSDPGDWYKIVFDNATNSSH